CRRLFEGHEGDERARELGGVSTRLPIHSFPGRDGFLCSCGIVSMTGSAYVVELALSNSVRKNPGSTSIVRMPNGAISGVSDSIHPSMPNFAAAYAVQNIWPAMPAVEDTVTSRPARCLRITGSTARVTFIGPNRSLSI